MKLITKYTDYAIRALWHMANAEKKLFSVSELSRALKIPMPFLRTILQILSREGIVASFKGKNGGFKLSSPLDKLFIVDLIKIFQGPIKFNTCIVKENICPDIRSCPLKKKIEKIEDYVNKEFRSATIKSLLKEEGVRC